MKLPRAPRSLRGRLTIWHALVLGLVLIAFTVAVYALLARSLATEIDRTLVDRAEEVNRSMQRGAAFGHRRPVEIPRPDRFASADTFVQIATLGGEILVTSDNLAPAKLPIDAAALASLRVGQPIFESSRVQGVLMRVYSTPLRRVDDPAGILQVARSLEGIERALGRLRLFAGAGLIVAVGFSGLVVWLTTGRALQPLEQLIQTAEGIGTARDLRRRVPAPVAEDEVGRLATTFNRMLERLEASDAELRSAYARVEDALQAQRRFVADASHELRTPLTTIRGNASMLRRFNDVSAQDRTEALDQIGHEAERMSRLVQDLLTLARADAGQRLRRQMVELAPLIEDVVGQVRFLAHERRFDLDLVTPASVVGDPDALHQLVLILLDNAVKYTQPADRICVSLGVTGDDVQITVADTGGGIAREDLPHIFERFYRANDGRNATGTGLGLSIAEWIVAEHGGRIAVSSRSGAGATFVVTLPLIQTTPPAIAQVAAPAAILTNL